MMNRKGDEIRYSVVNESDKLRWKMLRSLPTIEMSCDNDN